MAKITGSTWGRRTPSWGEEGSEPKVLITRRGSAHAVGGRIREGRHPGRPGGEASGGAEPENTSSHQTFMGRRYDEVGEEVRSCLQGHQGGEPGRAHPRGGKEYTPQQSPR